ncbi:MAG: helix-turn-helix transcriptional regulator [Mediterranea sp.]|jgi:AraC-like DNA-binding protein|nr:helix-turn-helix transcriptional regulator [Mediterranea sp.]
MKRKGYSALIRVTLAFFVCLSVGQAYAQTSYQKELDSLRQVIRTHDGKERLAAWERLQLRVSQRTANPDTLRAYYEQASSEARRQGSDAWTRMFVYYIEALGNAGQDSVVIRIAPSVLEEMPTDVSYFRGESSLLYSYYRLRMFATMMQEAKRTYEVATRVNSAQGICSSLVAMGVLYSTLHRPEDAIDCFRKCIAQAQGSPAVRHYQFFAYEQLCMVLSKLKRIDEAKSYFPRWEKVVEGMEGVDPNYHYPRFHFYNTQAYVYIAAKEFDKAEEAVNLAEKMGPADELSKASLTSFRGMIAAAHGRYAAGIQGLDEAYRVAVKHGQEIAKEDILKAKLQALAGWGAHNDQIYPLFEQIEALNDSLRQSNIDGMIDDLNARYKVDELKHGKQLAQLHAVIAISGCSFLLIFVVLLVLYNRKIRNKNHALYRRIKEIDSLRERHANIDMENLEIPNMAETAEEVTADVRLVQQLESLLLGGERQLPDSLTAESLAAALQSNRTSLRQAVKAVTGKTLNDYIRDIQLDNARRKLEMDENLTIEAIASECGFSSMTTFYRLFKEKYNILPTQYRRMAQKDKRA